MDGQVKLSQLPLRRIRSDGAVLCDGAGRGVERTGKGAGGGCLGRRGAVGAVSSTIDFALINHILAPQDTYNNQHTEIV